MKYWLIDNNMQYVCLVASKNDVYDRTWKTFSTLEDAKKWRDSFDYNKWMIFIHECSGNY